MRRRDKNLSDLRRVAESHGAAVEDDSEGAWRVYQCIAPTGRRWTCDGVHMLRVEWQPAQKLKGWSADIIAEAIARMNLGLVECPPDCECRDE